MWPILLVALLIVLQAGLINVLQIRTHAPIYPVVGFAFGGDFHEFGWIGADAYKETCPSNDRATHPPFFKQVLASVRFLSNPEGGNRFFWGNILCILISAALSFYLFFPLRRVWAALAIFAAAFFSYPVLMLLDRGNIDIWVIFFALVGIFGISRSKYFFAGSLIACSIASKVYPAVLLAPLVLQLQVRVLVWCALAFVPIYLWAPDAWNCFVSGVLVGRLHQVASYENGSLFVTSAWLVNQPFGNDDVLSNFLIIGGGAVLIHLLLDLMSNRWKLGPKDRAAWLLLYLPVTVAFPKTVYHYCLWCLLLLPFAYAYILSNTASWVLRVLIFFCCVGVMLSQFPAISLNAIQDVFWGFRRYRPEFYPGLGSLIVFLGHIPVKLMWLQQMSVKAKGDRQVGAETSVAVSNEGAVAIPEPAGGGPSL